MEKMKTKEKIMKVKVIKDAFYDLEYIKAGRVIEFKGKELPTWATLADGIETKKGNKKADAKVEEVPCVDAEKVEETAEVKTDEIPTEQEELFGKETAAQIDEKIKEEIAAEATAEENNAPDVSPEAQEYLERLINEGIEKGILIEDADKKTVKEQIEELEKALNKKEGK